MGSLRGLVGSYEVAYGIGCKLLLRVACGVLDSATMDLLALQVDFQI